MSRVYYISSSKPLEPLDNPYVKMVSINEAIALGADIDLELLDEIDPDEIGTVLWAEKEEDIEYPHIIFTNPVFDEQKYWVQIEGNPQRDITVLLKYVREAYMQNHNCQNGGIIEIWSVWNNENEKLFEEECFIDELTEDKLKKIFQQEKDLYRVVIK